MAPPDPDESQQLIFDIFHEIGNLVAAIRLQAHLLDEDLGAVGLARASLEIEGLGARTTSLLSVARPLMTGVSAGATCEPVEVLAGVEDLLLDVGLRGVELEVDVASDLPAVPIERNVLHPLLSSLAGDALEALGGKGTLGLSASRSAEFVEIRVIDSAAPDASLASWESDGRRGRGLAVSAAQRLLMPLGGHVAVDRSDDRTCISLFLPPR